MAALPIDLDRAARTPLARQIRSPHQRQVFLRYPIRVEMTLKNRMIGRQVTGAAVPTHRVPPNDISELPKWLVEPVVRSCRLFNTALDFVFYDVPTLRSALAAKAVSLPAAGLNALTDPEGSLLIIYATTAPHVHEYRSVEIFLESSDPGARDVDIATITGVGSSALGSAALAWDISVALERPVLAIVPGHGVAGVVLQALGGWFAFGLRDFLSSKSLIQTGLAMAAPQTARIGRELSASIPHEPTLHGAPIFRYGSGSLDVLHARSDVGGRRPSGYWSVTARVHCRSAARSSPSLQSARMGCASLP